MVRFLFIVLVGLFSFQTFAQTKSIKARYTVQAHGGISVFAEGGTIDETCQGGDGGVPLSISGTEPLTITWKDTGGAVVSNSESLENVVAGTYTVHITDGAGCSLTETYTVSYNCPDACNGTVNITGTTDASCGQNNGTVNASVIPSTSSTTFTYELKMADLYSGTSSIVATGSRTGNSLLSFNGLAYGRYTLNVAENASCSYSASASIGNAGLSISNYASTGINPVANGNCQSPSGQFSFVLNSSSTSPPDYTIRWKIKGTSTEWTQVSSSASIALGNLKAGNYAVRIEDNRTPGCFIDAEGNIGNNGIYLYASNDVVGVQSICSPANGSISLTVGGGSGSYSYSWSGPGGTKTTKDISGLSAGTYRLTAIDLVSGCTLGSDYDTYVVGNSTVIPSVSFNVVNNTNCSAPFNGSISLTASGTPGPYSYLWYDSDLSSVTGGSSRTALKPGNYGFEIKDQTTGCRILRFPGSSGTPVVGDVSTPALSITSSSVHHDTNCPEAQGNGSVAVVVNAGTSYTTSWTGPSSFAATNTTSISNLEHGQYELTVTVSCSTNGTPVLAGLASSLSYAAGELVLAPVVTVTDSDDAQLTSAVISISGYSADEDLLLFVNQSGITGSFNSTSGVLTLNGSSSIADYQSALRSVRYKNSVADRTHHARTITVKVNDGKSDSNLQSLTLTVPDQAPLISGIAGTSLSYTSDELVLAPAVAIADADDTQLAGALVSISEYITNEDVLLFSDQNGIQGTFNSTSGLLVLSGNSSITNYQSALRSIRYKNVAANRTHNDRSITVKVNDGDTDSNSETLTLRVPNQAPVIQGTRVTGSYVSGELTLNTGLTIIDGDNSHLSSARIVFSSGYQSGEDELTFATGKGIAGSFDAAAGVLSLSGQSTVENYAMALQSIVYHNKATDRTNQNRILKISVNDGLVESNAFTFTLTVPDIAPMVALSSSTISLTNDKVLLDAALTVNDLDDHVLVGAVVAFTSGYIKGEDELNGPAVSGITASFDLSTGSLKFSGSASVADYQLALQSVAYRNISTDRTKGDRVISLTVSDGQLNSNEQKVTIQVNNAAPVISSAVNSIFYSSGNLVINPSLVVSDVDNKNLSSASVRIVDGYQRGVDELLFVNQNGISGSFDVDLGELRLTGHGTLGNYQEALRSIQYFNSVEASNEADRTIAFSVTDDLNTSLVVRVAISINHPPVIQVQPQTIPAEGKVVLAMSSIFSDPDNNLDFQSVSVTSARGANAVVVDGAISIDYSSVPNFNGTDELTIRICDIGGRCKTEVVNVMVEGEVTVYSGVSVNGDSANPYFKIRFLPAGSKVSIYNRWGDLVFDRADYDSSDPSKRFDGISDSGSELTAGTYYYKIDVPNGKGLTGFLILKR